MVYIICLLNSVHNESIAKRVQLETKAKVVKDRKKLSYQLTRYALPYRNTYTVSTVICGRIL